MSWRRGVALAWIVIALAACGDDSSPAAEVSNTASVVTASTETVVFNGAALDVPADWQIVTHPSCRIGIAAVYVGSGYGGSCPGGTTVSPCSCSPSMARAVALQGEPGSARTLTVIVAQFNLLISFEAVDETTGRQILDSLRAS